MSFSPKNRIAFAVACLACAWLVGCISKGDTRVGQQEDEERDGGGLCAQMCTMIEEAGCTVVASCEANCVERVDVCEAEANAYLECVVDSEVTCNASGDPRSEDCDDEGVALFDCVNQNTISQCVANGDGCETCCTQAYREGSNNWDTELARCQCGTCADECANTCSSASADLEPSCTECTNQCLNDGQCYPGSDCVNYVSCSTSCPSAPSTPEPDPSAEPSTAPTEEPPVIGGPNAPLPDDVLGAGGMSSTEPLPPSPNLGVARRRIGQVQCALEMRCNYLLMNIAAGDEEYCVEQADAVNEWADGLPGNAFTIENLDACAQYLADLSCDEWHQPTAGCTFVGELADGEPCTDNGQCASAWCQAARFSCGECAPKPQEGDPCTHWSECPGADCRDGQCVPLGREGQSCDDESPCFGSFVTCVGGVCRKNDRALGESCGPTMEQPFCDQVTANLVCSSAGTCVEATVAQAGEACPSTGWCGGHGSCMDGVCLAGAGVGDACSDSEGPYCPWPLVCLEGACAGVPSSYECAAPTEETPEEPAPVPTDAPTMPTETPVPPMPSNMPPEEMPASLPVAPPEMDAGASGGPGGTPPTSP